VHLLIVDSRGDEVRLEVRPEILVLLTLIYFRKCRSERSDSSSSGQRAP
jgi:hypothetical protein